ncbi:MAG: hypothetical protein IKJ99_04385 [Oscillospiraceae bacterium]|nr:hypothetical protein [Oscillospiraceae bacterium]
MKRWLFLIAAVLLLCGCAAEPEETTSPTTVPTESIPAHITEPVGYYAPDSELEVYTEGAVLAYPLNRTDSYAAVTLAEDILLLSGQEVTTLTRLTGESLYVSAAANLDCYIPADSPAFHAGPRGITYYDELHQQLVYLDTGLKEVSRFSLPETAVGAPALTADRKKLYYCTEDAIRAIDLETGLDKLLRQTGYRSQSILSLHSGGSVLECRTEDSNGSAGIFFISTETGKTLYETAQAISLWTMDEAFFAIHREGEYPEKLSGNPESGIQLLITPEYHTPTEAVLALDSAVQSACRGSETELNLYNLTTGLRSHQVRLPGTETPWNMTADASGNCIWFLRRTEETGDILCRWDLTQTATDDKTVYTMPRPTAQNPDQAGLEALKKEAAALGSKYGVEILLWNDATARIPGSYHVEGEYQVPLLRRYLKTLDSALSVYPAGFLKEVKSGSKICIGLVRSISAAVTSADEPGLSSGFQFRGKDENVYIILSIGDDTVSTLYNDLALVIDNQVIISCSDFDSWEDLNPKGFEYTLSYRIASGLDKSLFQGADRAFIDPASTTFPREDRARIMAQAMMEGNEELFQSKTMQKKLRTLCLGIRKAFDLRKSSEVFLWEQYLETPLAKK